MTTLVLCQHCGHDFETQVEDRTEICPKCGQETAISATAPPAGQPTGYPSANASIPIIHDPAAAIRGRAGIFSGLAIASMILAIFTFISTLLIIHDITDHQTYLISDRDQAAGIGAGLVGSGSV